ncbi:hypothetical protein FVE85_6454 [Porphyridium purpureum]|uniref:Uncharacterized protein n=1 Tax=Porphyridium purpureum TaxID=35688 RepID=A0A5J4Z4F2_PORPP|nr:hypothetical protein FVE85_6454 [Porphyridium purpureum]|eukprot:POR1580..scf295_1
MPVLAPLRDFIGRSLFGNKTREDKKTGLLAQIKSSSNAHQCYGCKTSSHVRNCASTTWRGRRATMAATCANANGSDEASGPAEPSQSLRELYVKYTGQEAQCRFSKYSLRGQLRLDSPERPDERTTRTSAREQGGAASDRRARQPKPPRQSTRRVETGGLANVEDGKTERGSRRSKDQARPRERREDVGGASRWVALEGARPARLLKPRGRATRPPQAEPEVVKGNELKPRQSTTLFKLLCLTNTASTETCKLLIRAGSVLVNDTPCTDGERMVVLKKDVVTVQGRILDVRPIILGGSSDLAPSAAEANEAAFEPRRVKDFAGGKMEELKQKSGSKYNWRVDGGFYSGKRGRKGLQ